MYLDKSGLTALWDRMNTMFAPKSDLRDIFIRLTDGLSATKTELTNTKTELTNTKTDLANTKTDLDTAKTDLDNTKSDLANTKTDLANTKAELTATKTTADDAYSRTLRIELVSVPADDQGDTSRLTACVYRGGEVLTNQNVAKLGTLTWYENGTKKATGWTHTCGAGTAVECRLVKSDSTTSLAVASHTPYATQGHLEAVYATKDKLASYVPISGGTLTGNVAFGKGGSGWISGKTQENAPLQWLPVGVTDTTRYDPIMWGKSDNGDVWNIGVDPSGGIGFYAFKAGRTENGNDGHLTFDHKTGATKATKFIGPLQGNVTGNASTASKLSTARTINLTGAVSGSAKFDGSGDVDISTTVNNSDSVSLQRQIVPSAAVESSATASQAYAAGDYVVVNGVLRKVTAAIAKGNTISDSNSTATTVTNSIKRAEDNASKSASALNNVSKMFVGTVVSTVDSSTTASGHEARLFTKDEFAARFGRPFNPSKDYVGVMNADGAAAGAFLDSATRFASGNIWVGVPGGANGNTIRLNYLVVLGD